MQAEYFVRRIKDGSHRSWRLVLHVNGSWQNEWQYNTNREIVKAYNEATAYLKKHGRPPVEDM